MTGFDWSAVLDVVGSVAAFALGAVLVVLALVALFGDRS